MPLGVAVDADGFVYMTCCGSGQTLIYSDSCLNKKFIIIVSTYFL